VRRTVLALLAIAGCATALQAAPRQIDLRPGLLERSPFKAGDAFVAQGQGVINVLRNGRQLATIVDPENLLTAPGNPSQPLYITDLEGNLVRSLEPGMTVFVSREAPAIVFYRRDFAGRPAHGHGGGSSPLMTLHGGDVITASKTMAIFWGSSWNNASFAGDKISGLDSFFSGFDGSNYAGTSTEYYGTNDGYVTRNSTYLGHQIDSSALPRRALSVSQAIAEACSVTGNNPDPDALYAIFTETGAGHVNYCAWHSWGNCSNGAPVQVAYLPNIDGIAGCDPGDTWTTHSQGLAAVANVTAHELSETITDPRGASWYDSSGEENGDKCAWAFHGPVTFSNGSVWKLQMEWSNDAYSSNSGYANLSGQKGCLQGQ
jgi:hypothetical protein